ncbi:MAG: two component transcriptional regulator, LuxR family [Dehalococcoidia bacterium]|nr:two component transcriptional regulator, LuxR family [Dehalococcoidia bacterium]
MRVLVVDDHALVRGVLARFLSGVGDIQVVGEAGDGNEAIAAVRRLCPDLVLMDVRMPGCDGIEATRRIKLEMPQVKIVALTISEEVSDLVQIIRNGAEGYLLKDATPEELITALRQVAEGEAALSPRVAAKVFHEFAPNPKSRSELPRTNDLSPRETEVLRLVAEGASNREVSARLSLSESTVRNHLHHILGKLHVRNRLQAVLVAESYGLLSSSSQQDRGGAWRWGTARDGLRLK